MERINTDIESPQQAINVFTDIINIGSVEAACRFMIALGARDKIDDWLEKNGDFAELYDLSIKYLDEVDYQDKKQVIAWISAVLSKYAE